MRKVGYSLILTSFLLLSVRLHIAAQDTDIPMFAAYTVDDNLYLFKPNEMPQFIDYQPDFVRGLFPRDLTWSHDGHSLAFQNSEGLAIFNVATKTTTQLLATTFPELPLAFSLDDKYILFADEGGGNGINGPYWRDISKIEIDSAAKREKVGQIKYLCCYGGGEFIPPATEALEEEQGSKRGFRMLQDTPYGILAAYISDGVQLNDKPIASFDNAYLSHRRDKFASILDQDQIAIVDLKTQAIQYLQLEVSPTTVAWGENDESLFYASSEIIRDMYDDLTATEQQTFLNKQGPVEYRFGQPILNYNQASIYQLNLSDGTHKLILEMDVFAIARLMPSLDGDAVFFSVIPNMDEWLQVTLNSVVNCYTYECYTQYSQPSLYRLSLPNGEVTLIGHGLYNAAFNFSDQ